MEEELRLAEAARRIVLLLSESRRWGLMPHFSRSHTLRGFRPAGRDINVDVAQNAVLVICLVVLSI